MTTRFLGAAGILLILAIAASMKSSASPDVAAARNAAGQNPAPQNPASQVPASTAVIRGRVTAADTGLPLRRAQVYLNSTMAQESRSTGTDETGRYEFAGLPAGTYMLSATKTGYVRLAYGQRSAAESGRPVDLTAGRTLDRIDLVLPRGGVIVATVTDRYGDPITGIRVDAMQYRFFDGQRRLIGVGTSLETNDLGQARLYGLAPGSYYVVAGQAGGTASMGLAGRTYVPTFHPGTTRIREAQQVDLDTGRETSVALSLALVNLATLSGTMRTSDGAPAPSGAQGGMRTSALLLDAESFVGPKSIALQANGRFSLAEVPPGDYFLEVRASRSEPRVVSSTPDPGNRQTSTWNEYASVRLAVSGEDMRDLEITTQKGATISGRIAFDAGSPPAGWRPQDFPVRVAQTRDGGLLATGDAVVRDDYSFEVANVAATGLLRLQPMVTGWFAKKVVIDGKDVTHVPMTFEPGRDYRDVQLVLTQKRSEVGGTVVDTRGRALDDFVVVLFPEERTWRNSRSQMLRAARPDQNGRFRINLLPDGRYLVVALGSIEQGSEQDLDLLSKLEPRAQRLVLSEGEVKSIRLTMQELR